MKTNTIITLVAASAISLFSISCKSETEQAREANLEHKADRIEDAATQLRKDGEKVADMKEDQADAIRNNNTRAADGVENSADATRRSVEKTADRLEDKADAVREQK